jgi:hypothetical protein
LSTIWTAAQQVADAILKKSHVMSCLARRAVTSPEGSVCLGGSNGWPGLCHRRQQ